MTDDWKEAKEYLYHLKSNEARCPRCGCSMDRSSWTHHFICEHCEWSTWNDEF